MFPGRSVAEFPSPSGTFMLVEQPNVNNLLGTSDDAWSFGPYNAFEPGGGINVNWRTQDCAGTTNPINGTCSSAASLGSPLHSGGWNYLYVDGHVKWLFPSNTFGTPGRQPVGHTLNPNTTGWCNATAQSPCGPWTLDENDN